jgi:hypothetical protein
MQSFGSVLRIEGERPRITADIRFTKWRSSRTDLVPPDARKISFELRRKTTCGLLRKSVPLRVIKALEYTQTGWSCTITSAANSSVERRNATRYKIGVPAKFSWKGVANKRSTGKGTVLDMSVEGIFVLTTAFPQIDAEVIIEIGHTKDLGRSKNLIKARMKVVRIDQEVEAGPGIGFAATGKVLIRRISGGGEKELGLVGPVIFKKSGNRGDPKLSSLKRQESTLIHVSPISAP